MFGDETARACKRAKYWLGYEEKNMHPNFGIHLFQQLSGKRELSKEQKARRNARLRKQQQTPLRMKALNRAKKDIGMKENPAGSNICPISQWYGMIGAWCAMAVTRWYVDSGSKRFRRGQRWAYVPYIVESGIRGEYGLSLTRYPKPGDLVCFDWDNDGIADHIGLLATSVGSNGNFKTVEGNTAVGNDSNGGQVMERDRSTSDLVTYKGRPIFIHAAG